MRLSGFFKAFEFAAQMRVTLGRSWEKVPQVFASPSGEAVCQRLPWILAWQEAQRDMRFVSS